MNENQLHLTNRPAYLQGCTQGWNAAVADQDYRPQDGAGSQADQQAYSLGYADGWAAALEWKS